jgi:nitronate monooxygenase
MKPPASTARLCEALGIDVPILGAPMACIAGGRLASAVSRSGALGFLGGGYGDIDWIAAELAGIDVSTLGVGLILWKLDEQPAALDAVLSRGPRAIWLSYGNPAPYIGAIHTAGAAAVCQVLDPESAVAACDAGADVVVIQGSEAGGHGRPGRSLVTVLPAVIDRVPNVPVIAAGGIATAGSSPRAGSSAPPAWPSVPGSTPPPRPSTPTPRRPSSSSCAATRPSNHCLRHRPRTPLARGLHRTRRSQLPRHTMAPLLAELEADLHHQRRRYRAAVDADDMDTRVLWAGEAVDFIDAIEPARKLIETLHRDALDA